ncbi:hypothetical protein AWB76_03727 [Caballeronia temeraria]|uniref:Uncharacterized protein n=1 Tax=Caballeronia temeraria TaxID=1777137 RepID=A0A158B962_9BURK|nr:hypothetical protein [Caballeronia temeraria]SAK65897.1 hypothetical protein AWB76_03727 [Caballeronia temeraria]
MKSADQIQRMEELQQALSDAFEGPKNPAVGALDDGDDVVANVSWVVETGRDTTLDSRCSASVRFAARQIERYAAMDTAQRIIVQDRMITRVRDAFDNSRAGRTDANECSLAILADDDWFDVPATL